MKNKTVYNMRRAVRMIMAKGYDREEANELAIRMFDTHSGDSQPIEYYIEKILPKEEYMKQYGLTEGDSNHDKEGM